MHIAQFKPRELLETPEEDNQQPSLESDLSEGSTTSSYGLTETMKDHERGASKIIMPFIKTGYPNITHLFKESLFKDSKSCIFIFDDDIV